MQESASIDRQRIKTIVFDVGGVLVQLHGTPFKPEWLPEPLVDQGVWPRWLGSEAVKRFETGHIEGDVFVREFIEEIGLNVEPDEFVEHFMCWPARLFPGVPEMLQELGRGYRLAALSNSNALHWPMLLERFQLQSMIPDCVSSHQIRVMKPARQAFERMLDRLQLEAREILFLDDYQASIDVALAMGMQAFKVTGTRGGVQTVRMLGLLDEQSPADVIVN